MPVPDTSGVPPFADFDMLKNKINEIVQKYNNLLVNMDSLNVVSLTADHIDTGTLDANIVTIAADDGSGKFYRIDTNGIVANNGLFNTLLFDLASGLLTVTSALVQSAAGYPKVELNSANNLVAAYADSDSYIAFVPNGTGSVPAIALVDANTIKGFLNRAVGGTTLGSFDGENLNLQAGGNLVLNPTGTLNIGSNTGASGSFFVSSAPGAPADTMVTFTKGIRTG